MDGLHEPVALAVAPHEDFGALKLALCALCARRRFGTEPVVSARGDPSGRRGHDLVSGARFTRPPLFERKKAFQRLDQLLLIHRPLPVARGTIALDGHAASELCDRQNLQA